MTVRLTLLPSIVTGEPCVSCEDIFPALNSVTRGWQPNPLITPEAAAMCGTDYKSALRRPRKNVHMLDRQEGRRRGKLLRTG